MTKDALVEAVAKVCDSKAQASRAVDAMIEAISKGLSSGQKVTITGFGTFLVSQRAARQGRNPQTGESISIPAMKVPRFKAGKALKEAVK